MCTLAGRKLGAYAVAFAPGGQHVVSSSGDKLAKIWNSETGAEVSRFLECVGGGGVVGVFCGRFQHGLFWMWPEMRVGGRCSL